MKAPIPCAGLLLNPHLDQMSSLAHVPISCIRLSCCVEVTFLLPGQWNSTKLHRLCGILLIPLRFQPCVQWSPQFGWTPYSALSCHLCWYILFTMVSETLLCIALLFKHSSSPDTLYNPLCGHVPCMIQGPMLCEGELPTHADTLFVSLSLWLWVTVSCENSPYPLRLWYLSLGQNLLPLYLRFLIILPKCL